MNLAETFGHAVRALTAHALRSALSMLGMVFGVAAVIAMLAIGAGAQRQALEMIEMLGIRNVLVRARDFPDQELQEIRKKSPGLALRDVEAVAGGVPGVADVLARVVVEPYSVTSAEGRSNAAVAGVSHRHRHVFPVRLTAGRFLDLRDELEMAQVCVIGSGVHRDLFGHRHAIGQLLKVNDLWLEVVGVLAPRGQGGTGIQGVAVSSTDQEILIPVTTAQRKLDRPVLKSPLDEIVVYLEPDASPREVAGGVQQLLDQLHGGANDFEIVVPEALLEQSRRTQRLFAIVMGCIAGISLLVGGIGIMNIMLASVLERTREIGLRRAVGARRADIRGQFVIEASSISLAGGAAGVLLGIVLARVVAAAADWPTVVTGISVVLSVGVSITVGLASGIYPALRAAELDPIEALRYE